ncbi:MAG: polyphenol oxidase family protein [Acidimicrobiia bacterium]
MIQPAPGVAFTWSGDGDIRADEDRRRVVASELGIERAWAVVDQVHGSQAHVVAAAGTAGEGDALVSTTPRLPLAIFTADCLGVVLAGPGTIAVAHAGWRGLAAGVLEAATEAMAAERAAPVSGYIGPGIGPCCFEVGEEVADLFGHDVSATTWGTRSVDLVAAATRRLSSMEVWVDGRCTACGGGFSHRRDATPDRLAALGWIA